MPELVLRWGSVVLVWGADVALLGMLVRTRLVCALPALATYAAWQVFRTPTVAATATHYGRWTSTYFYAYWVGAVVAWALFFPLILELGNKALESYPGLRRLFRTVVFCTTAATMTLIAASLVAAQAIDLPTQWINSWMYLLQRSVRLAHAGLLLTLVVFLRWFRLPVSRLLQSLMLGWLFVTTNLFALGALRFQLGPRADMVLILLDPLSYVCIVSFLAWAVWKWGLERLPQPAFVLTPVAFSDDRRQAVLQRLESILSGMRR